MPARSLLAQEDRRTVLLTLASMPAPMSPALQALCYFYRNPPPDSGVKPQPYRQIPGLLKAPHLGVGRIKMAVKRFHNTKKSRGRKTGWRKTTPAEDAKIFSCFQKVRLPLGSLVEARDVWKALPPALRNRITMRTVLNLVPCIAVSCIV